jgi:hypothetical protein
MINWASFLLAYPVGLWTTITQILWFFQGSDDAAGVYLSMHKIKPLPTPGKQELYRQKQQAEIKQYGGYLPWAQHFQNKAQSNGKLKMQARARKTYLKHNGLYHVIFLSQNNPGDQFRKIK